MKLKGHYFHKTCWGGGEQTKNPFLSFRKLFKTLAFLFSACIEQDLLYNPSVF